MMMTTPCPLSRVSDDTLLRVFSWLVMSRVRCPGLHVKLEMVNSSKLDRKPQKALGSKVNPFERKPVSLKYNVLGKVKGQKSQSKSLAVARSEAFQKRKQSLLVEATQASKENKFIDRRFAEDQSIPEEDKMLMRFQRERLARARKGGFNLDDDDDLVTHGGVSLGDIEHFDAHDKSDSDDENLGRDTVKEYHFGGFRQVDSTEDNDRVKSKREVMQEIIAKSKMHKAEKRREKAEREDMIDKLNDDFKDISSLLDVRVKEKTKRSGRRPEVAVEHSTENEDPTDFDVLTRVLATEIKARPTDRLKTPEESAKELFENLQKAEKARLERMQGTLCKHFHIRMHMWIDIGDWRLQKMILKEKKSRHPDR
jgi:nucleolar protein 14